MESPYEFTRRLVLVFVGIVALVLIVRMVVLPESWGEYGYYRGDYIEEEAARPLVHGTNDSCKSCHETVYEMKHAGAHHRLSCETCHAPLVEHVRDGEKFADMPVRRGEAQTQLCLKCHQRVIGRPETFPMIDAAAHLDEQGVRPTHECNRCHTVHAPLEAMQYVKRLRDVKEEVSHE